MLQFYFSELFGFKKIDDFIDESVNEKCCLMRWGEGEQSNSSFIYFNNSIKNELIEKYDLESKLHFYNIQTINTGSKNSFSINIADNLKKENNKVYIKDYIDVRNKLGSILKAENIIIYFDCNDTYDYLHDVIKDIIKVRNAKLSIVMHTPFSIEGTKKIKIYESIKKKFEKYNFIEIDYERIGKDLNISFKDAFDSRDEEMLKTISKAISK